MSKTTHAFVGLLVVSALGAGPAWATCSVCVPGGECSSVETSGNCSCNIRYTDRGFAICRPQGVCDPNDSMSCSGGPGTNKTDPARIDVAGFRHLEELDPLVGAVLWGATDAAFAPDGSCLGSSLRIGTQTGTMDSETGGYSWKLSVNDAGGGRFEVRGLLTSVTGQEIAFRGDFRDSGREGRIMIERDHRGTAPRALSWNVSRTKPAEQ
ncbi:MAG: hypothetical protein ABUT39_26895 [Acidobacteriota bacterium]